MFDAIVEDRPRIRPFWTRAAAGICALAAIVAAVSDLPFRFVIFATFVGNIFNLLGTRLAVPADPTVHLLTKPRSRNPLNFPPGFRNLNP